MDIRRLLRAEVPGIYRVSGTALCAFGDSSPLPLAPVTARICGPGPFGKSSFAIWHTACQDIPRCPRTAASGPGLDLRETGTGQFCLFESLPSWTDQQYIGGILQHIGPLLGLLLPCMLGFLLSFFAGPTWLLIWPLCGAYLVGFLLGSFVVPNWLLCGLYLASLWPYLASVRSLLGF